MLENWGYPEIPETRKFGGSRNFQKNVNNPAERSKSRKTLILKKDRSFEKIRVSRNFRKNVNNPEKH